MVKNPPANAGDSSLISGSGRSPGGGNGNPLQYSCLGNPMDRGAWRATVHGVAKSWTRLSTHTYSGTFSSVQFSHSVVSDSVTPWTMARQAPLSMGFPRQEYRNGLLFPSPGDLPNLGIEPTSLMSPALAGGFFTTEPPGKPCCRHIFAFS